MTEEIQIFFKVLGAAFLTGLIGWEREDKDKPAGFRTHMLVGLSTTLLVCLGDLFVAYYAETNLRNALRYDPLRVIEAIIVGISFIGAGTILKSHEQARVRYLTSAATILSTAGIGIAVALDKYLLAALVTALVLIINRIMHRWEDSLNAEA